MRTVFSNTFTVDTRKIQQCQISHENSHVINYTCTAFDAVLLQCAEQCQFQVSLLCTAVTVMSFGFLLLQYLVCIRTIIQHFIDTVSCLCRPKGQEGIHGSNAQCQQRCMIIRVPRTVCKHMTRASFKSPHTKTKRWVHCSEILRPIIYLFHFAIHVPATQKI